MVSVGSDFFMTRREPADFRTTELRLTFAGRRFTERLFMKITISVIGLSSKKYSAVKLLLRHSIAAND